MGQRCGTARPEQPPQPDHIKRHALPVQHGNSWQHGNSTWPVQHALPVQHGKLRLWGKQHC